MLRLTLHGGSAAENLNCCSGSGSTILTWKKVQTARKWVWLKTKVVSIITLANTFGVTTFFKGFLENRTIGEAIARLYLANGAYL